MLEELARIAEIEGTAIGVSAFIKGLLVQTQLRASLAGGSPASDP